MKIPHITPNTISVSECYLNCFQYYVMPGVGEENCHAAQRAGEYEFQRDTHPRFLPGLVASFLAEKYNYRRKVRKIDVIALNEFLDENPWNDVGHASNAQKRARAA